MIARHLFPASLNERLTEMERFAAAHPESRDADAVKAIGEASDALRAAMGKYGFAALGDDRLRTVEAVMWGYFLQGNPGYEHTPKPGEATNETG